MNMELEFPGDRLEAEVRSRRNISDMERWASIAAGAALAIYGLSRRRKSGWILTFLGGWLVQRGASAHCYTYDLLGVSTAQSGNDTRRALGGRAAGPLPGQPVAVVGRLVLQDEAALLRLRRLPATRLRRGAAMHRLRGARVAEALPEDAIEITVLIVGLPDHDEIPVCRRRDRRVPLIVHGEGVDLKLAADGSRRAVELSPDDAPVASVGAGPYHDEVAHRVGCDLGAEVVVGSATHLKLAGERRPATVEAPTANLLAHRLPHGDESPCPVGRDAERGVARRRIRVDLELASLRHPGTVDPAPEDASIRVPDHHELPGGMRRHLEGAPEALVP